MSIAGRLALLQHGRPNVPQRPRMTILSAWLLGQSGAERMDSVKTLQVPDSYAAQFCVRLIYERDNLNTAQYRDLHNPRPQRGPWGRSRVGRLVGLFRPRYGFGIAQQLYQKALAEAAQGTMPTILAPLLTAAWDAHSAMVNADSPADHLDAIAGRFNH